MLLLPFLALSAGCIAPPPLARSTTLPARLPAPRSRSEPAPESTAEPALAREAPQPPRAILIYKQGLADEEMYPLSRALTVGRGAQNDIQIKQDSKVARYHCRFFFEKGAWTVEDIRSSGGTLVNGELVTTRPLSGGEEIRIGQTSFRFVHLG